MKARAEEEVTVLLEADRQLTDGQRQGQNVETTHPSSSSSSYDWWVSGRVPTIEVYTIFWLKIGFWTTGRSLTEKVAGKKKMSFFLFFNFCFGISPKMGRPRRHGLTNVAVPRSVFGVQTWNFDTWFRARSSKHYLEIAQKTKKKKKGWLFVCFVIMEVVGPLVCRQD